MQSTWFLLFAIGPILSGCASSTSPSADPPSLAFCQRSFTPEQVRQEADSLIHWLRTLHPGLYRSTDSKAVEQAILDLRSPTDAPRSYLDLLHERARLFTTQGDIRTTWGHAPWFIACRNDSIPLLPLQLRWTGKAFRIVGTVNGDSTLVGQDLIAFQGEVMERYFQKNRDLLPIEGREEAVQRHWLATYLPYHHANFWEVPDTFRLRIGANNGKEQEVTLPALLRKDFLALIQEPECDPFVPGLHHEGPRVVLRTSTHGDDLERVLDSLFATLTNNPMDTLVLDLRGNDNATLSDALTLWNHVALDTAAFLFKVTGSLRIEPVVGPAGEPLTEALLQRATTHTHASRWSYPGPLIIRADGLLLEGWGLLCARARLRANTFFEGDPVGVPEDVLHSGVVSRQLPHSEMRIRVSTLALWCVAHR